MAEYYELSMSSKVSAEQREFNREMVAKIKFEALNYGWEFDEEAFDDSGIRIRIRRFYTVSLYSTANNGMHFYFYEDN